MRGKLRQGMAQGKYPDLKEEDVEGVARKAREGGMGVGGVLFDIACYDIGNYSYNYDGCTITA